MTSNSSNTQQAALSIEEIFEQPKPQQTWLLTYIDVFVLIIMLVVTLLTLSDFDTAEKATTQQTKQNKTTKPKSQHKVLIKKTNSQLSSTANTEKKLLKTTHTTPENTAFKDIETDQNTTKNNTLVTKQKIQPQKTSHQKDTLAAVKEASQTKISQRLQASLDNQQDNDFLQQQLLKTVDELGLTDSVKMKVTLGYAQLEIQDKVLFDSSKAELLNAGESLLKKLAPLLEQSLGLIYIEGHTDNRPIKTVQYPSNWELGAARATSVLHYLVTQQLDSSRLRAVTYADTKPLADNTTKEGRGKNRRVSIVIKVSDKID